MLAISWESSADEFGYKLVLTLALSLKRGNKISPLQ